MLAIASIIAYDYKRNMPVFATNRKARFDYDIKDTLEAGVALLGSEAKSIREGKVRLTGSYAVLKNGEIWLYNMEISPYQPGNTPDDLDPARNRRLLLNKKEIVILAKAIDDRMSLIPLSLYSKGKTIKVELGIGRARRQFDKRESIKKKDIGREVGKRIK
ncbi:MAG: SsrA-binding protein SmpB [Candidatus Colwellbacteria bacterium]|nr:SsrA-binding protein SmpB [Candidatus Colwellbacteria bacterium]